MAFWRGRTRRFSPEERAVFFSRLFGVGEVPVLAGSHDRNTKFEPLMTSCSFECRTVHARPLRTGEVLVLVGFGERVLLTIVRALHFKIGADNPPTWPPLPKQLF